MLFIHIDIYYSNSHHLYTSSLLNPYPLFHFFTGHMNVENMHYQNMDRDIEEYGRVTHNTNNIVPVNTGPELTMAQKQHQILNSHSEWKVCIFLHIFVCIYMYIYICTYIYVYFYLYLYFCVYTYTYIHVYIYIII
jgi:hypothetical protein